MEVEEDNPKLLSLLQLNPVPDHHAYASAVLCLSLCLCLCLCVCLSVCLSACLSVYLCVRARVRVCACARVLSGWLPPLLPHGLKQRLCAAPPRPPARAAFRRAVAAYRLG